MLESELKNMMETIQGACDVVRVVDPATFEARTLDEDGEFNKPYTCFSALNVGRRCENCISMRAVGENRTVSKFELCDGDAYFISARPIEVDGKPRSLEMVQKVSDDIGLQDGVDALFEHIKKETDHEFMDGFTEAYSRRYFDEGLSSLPGRKLAVLRVQNLADVNAAQGHSVGDLLLKRIAHELLVHTGVEDSVIRYKGDVFAIQFEDRESEGFPLELQHILDAVDDIYLPGYPTVHPRTSLAAIDEDATFGELAQRALALLAESEREGKRLVFRSSDTHHHARVQARRAAFDETLHRSPDKPSVDTDALTGLLSSTGMRERLHQLAGERHTRSEGYCVVYLDIVNFRQFNREYGRSDGDVLLKFIADRIREEFPHDSAARLGGDVFLVLTDSPDVEACVGRLREQVAAYQRRIALELKAGVNAIDEAMHDATTAIDLAKEACRSIKNRYDVGIRYYDSELDHEIGVTEYVVNNIDRAIEEGRIKVFYQPIIRAMTGHVCDFECLCRWDDPAHGLLPPSAFISTLERFHLINKLDSYVVRQACAHQAQLMAQGKQLVPVSVNLSRLDFQLEDIFSTVEQAVAEAGIPRNMLNIEVTESALDDDRGEFDAQLERFREAGYEVWMDDFGSGYSSLNLLKDYRFDTLKMDMAFLAGFEDNPKSREIIVTVVDMAKKLGIRTLVEGVETHQQRRFLQRIGCEMLQGFYFSRPLPYDEDAFSNFIMEDAEEREYFDALGSVNLLGLPADEGEAAAAGYVTESESRSAPLALVEYRNGTYRYLSANEAYLKLLDSVDADTLDDLQEMLEKGTHLFAEQLQAQLEETRASGAETFGNYLQGSGGYQVHIQHVAKGPGAHAFVIAPVPLS